MAERPLLVFPVPVNTSPPAGLGFPVSRVRTPNTTGQATRLQQQFEKAHVEIMSVPGADKVLVLETIGKLPDFQKAAKSVGMQWLAELDDELEFSDVELLYPDADPNEQKKLEKEGARLYLAASNQSALKHLIGLWDKFQSGENLQRGYGVWKNFFEYLKDVRYWNHDDMLRATGMLHQWQEDIDIGVTDIPFEIELHFRFTSPSDRRQVESNVINRITAAGGKVLGNPVEIEEIGFHALKATLPAAVIRRHVVEFSVSAEIKNVLSPDNIKFCRPMSATGVKTDELPSEQLEFELVACNNLEPIVALFDGLPLMQHELLVDRIILDDPDNYAARYGAANQRQHGTAMASLICHADFNASRGKLPRSLPRKIYARPVMSPNQQLSSNPEEFDTTEFPEDITERAVRRLFKGVDGQDAVAPGIRVVNLSLGNEKKVFLREMSPWARLLDWLAYKYRVLFVISTGNYYGDIKIDGQSDFIKKALSYQSNNKHLLRIISPAESINSLTVGALNIDMHQQAAPEDLVDLIGGRRLPALYSRLGSGYRNQIKPDILVSGGTLHYRPVPDSNAFEANWEYEEQGLAHATPGRPPRILDDIKSTTGTSNAAAITSHAAGHIFEVLESIRSENSRMVPGYDALLIKALLVHGASWDGLNFGDYDVLKTSANKMRWKQFLSQFIGYGEADFSRVEECTTNRVTVLGFGELHQKLRHVFNLPFPAELVSATDIRLTTTLAWFSPINPRHHAFRRARLLLDVSGVNVQRREGDWQQVKKGTVQHEIFTVSSVTAVTDIQLNIDCKADSGQALDDLVLYGLAVTLETSENIDIYNAIAQSLAAPVPAA